MTEYETAALAISQAQVTAQYISAALATLIGAGQIGLIGYGLHRMRVASEQRDRQLDAMEARQEAQGQVLAGIGQALERQGQALEQQGQVLAELLRRGA